jgi:hypothetical protein
MDRSILCCRSLKRNKVDTPGVRELASALTSRPDEPVVVNCGHGLSEYFMRRSALRDLCPHVKGELR